jgi:hypothetical protein
VNINGKKFMTHRALDEFLRLKNFPTSIEVFEGSKNFNVRCFLRVF